MIDGRRTGWLLILALLVLPGCGGGGAEVAQESPAATGLLFTSDRDGNEEIYRMEADGSALQRLTTHPAVDTDGAWSPDGRRIAFRSRRDGSSDLFLMGSDGRDPVNLARDPAESIDDEFAPRWAPDQQSLLLYTDRFQIGPCSRFHHLARMPISGGTASIVAEVGLSGGQESFDWSPDGRAMVISHRGCGEARPQLLYFDLESGEMRPLTDGTHLAIDPRVSHDGRLVVFASEQEDNLDLYLLDLDDGALSRLTTHPARDLHPTWSPDDQQIAFTSWRDGNAEIYLIDRDGTPPTNLTRHPANDTLPDWSPVPP